MNTGDAMRMIGAELLKLRRQRGMMATTAFLTVGVVLIAVIVSAALHASNPAEYDPAGGRDTFFGIMSGVAFYVALACGALGASGGGQDVRAGVFRDLVATGRSRITLFGVRYPAIVLVGAIFTTVAVAVASIVGFVAADGAEALSGSDVARWVGFYALVVVFTSAVGLGVGALLTNATVSSTVVIVWLLIAGPLIGAISYLGPVRHVISTNALYRFMPMRQDEIPEHSELALGTAGLILVAWIVLSLAVGAWRTKTRDA